MFNCTITVVANYRDNHPSVPLDLPMVQKCLPTGGASRRSTHGHGTGVLLWGLRLWISGLCHYTSGGSLVLWPAQGAQPIGHEPGKSQKG